MLVVQGYFRGAGPSVVIVIFSSLSTDFNYRFDKRPARARSLPFAAGSKLT